MLAALTQATGGGASANASTSISDSGSSGVGLKNNDALNQRDANGYTPLIVFAGRAALQTSEKSPRMSESSMASTTATTSSSTTMGNNNAAVDAEDLQLGALLLALGSKATMQDDKGMSAFHWCSMSGDVRTMLFLLYRVQSEKNSVSSSSTSSIVPSARLTVTKTNEEMQKSAQFYSEKFKKRTSDELFVTELSLNPGIIRPILSQQDAAGDTPLHVASRHGHANLVRVLLHCFNLSSPSVTSSVSTSSANPTSSLLLPVRNSSFETPYDVLCAALPTDTVTQRRRATRARAECRKLFFEYRSGHRTLFLSHDDCLEHRPRSDDEWESPQRIDAIFDALNGTDYSDWFDTSTELEMSKLCIYLFSYFFFFFFFFFWITLLKLTNCFFVSLFLFLLFFVFLSLLPSVDRL